MGPLPKKREKERESERERERESAKLEAQLRGLFSNRKSIMERRQMVDGCLAIPYMHIRSLRINFTF